MIGREIRWKCSAIGLGEWFRVTGMGSLKDARGSRICKFNFGGGPLVAN